MRDLFPGLDEDMGFPLTRNADAWLKNLGGKSVTDQLRERWIRRVKATITNGMSGHMNILEDGGFSVSVAVAIIKKEGVFDQNVDEMALTLGHEIGHTFQFDMQGPVPVDRSPPMSRGDELWTRVEDYCEAFGKRWLEIGGNRRETAQTFEKLWGITDGIRKRALLAMEILRP